jgi:uncharacterized membrane protein
MPPQLHELHPSLVHAPLVLLPAAAGLDLAAVVTRGRLQRLALDTAGRRLWWAGFGAAALAGVAGLAASQEVHLPDARSRDALRAHGMANVGILAAALGLAAWRSRHRAGVASAALGATAAAASTYTAWLGGEFVHGHGAGVKAMGRGDSPPLLSPKAPLHLLRDAGRGIAWLLRRGGPSATGSS